MPFAIKMPEKIVLLNEKTKATLQTLHEVLAQQKLLHDNKDDTITTDSEQLRESWWAKIVLAAVEQITNVSLEAHKSTLPAIDLKIDPPAAVLRDAYIDYLNALLIEEGLGPNQAEQKEIKSHFVLIRELLIRLATVALCTDMDAKRDGDKIIAVMENFIKELAAKNILHKEDFLFFKGSLSTFGIQLSIGHNKWITCFKNMVRAIKLLHKKTSIISSTLNHLHEVKLTTVRQIIAILDPESNKANLAVDWLRDSLAKCERQLLVTESAIQPHPAMVSSWHIKTLTAYQKEIIDFFPEQGKMQSLYDLLIETNVLQEALENIDLIITFSGWVPIMTGVLRLEQLAQRIQTHGHLCEQVLTVSKSDVVWKQSAGAALHGYGAGSGLQYRELAEELSEELTDLQNPQILSELAKIIIKPVSGLIELEKVLGFTLINQEKLHALERAHITEVLEPAHKKPVVEIGWV